MMRTWALSPALSPRISQVRGAAVGTSAAVTAASSDEDRLASPGSRDVL